MSKVIALRRQSQVTNEQPRSLLKILTALEKELGLVGDGTSPLVRLTKPLGAQLRHASSLTPSLESDSVSEE